MHPLSCILALWDKMAGSSLTALITGANTGIGLETAKALVRKGYRAKLACRDIQKGTAAKDKIMLDSPQAKVEVVQLDLADLTSVKKTAASLLDEGNPVDVLVNNAGVMACPRMETADGFEYQLGVNHLGHFALTTMLLPLMNSKERPARIVNVSSSAHEVGTIQFDDINSEEAYDKWKAYGQSKLANILFTLELSKQLPADWSITANCLHPGVVTTELSRYLLPEKIPWYMSPLVKIAGMFFLTPEQGAATSIFLASSPDVENVSGKYFVKCEPSGTNVEAKDEAVAKKLWDLSLDLTKIEDPFTAN